MTKAELIEQLRPYPEDAQVLMPVKKRGGDGYLPPHLSPMVMRLGHPAKVTDVIVIIPDWATKG